MNKILVIVALPNYEQSSINKGLVSAIAQKGLVIVHNLATNYGPLLQGLNVEHEQRLLVDHDAVVFQEE